MPLAPTLLDLSPLMHIASRWASPKRQVRKETPGGPVTIVPHQAVEKEGVDLGPCVVNSCPCILLPLVGTQESPTQGSVTCTSVTSIDVQA